MAGFWAAVRQREGLGQAASSAPVASGLHQGPGWLPGSRSPAPVQGAPARPDSSQEMDALTCGSGNVPEDKISPTESIIIPPGALWQRGSTLMSS